MTRGDAWREDAHETRYDRAYGAPEDEVDPEAAEYLALNERSAVEGDCHGCGAYDGHPCNPDCPIRAEALGEEVR